MTYQQAAQMALDCQDASNLSGVAKSFAGPVMDALWDEARRTGHGTDWINQHPIVTLFLDKLASLNRTLYLEYKSTSFSKTWDAVEQIAKAPLTPASDPAEYQRLKRAGMGIYYGQ